MNKYRAKATMYEGVRYASKAESERAWALDQDIKNGAIKLWIGQPKFRLGCPENVYIADFFVLSANGEPRVEDVKGAMTAKFRRDVKLWHKYGPCDLWIIRGGRVGRVIIPEHNETGCAFGFHGA